MEFHRSRSPVIGFSRLANFGALTLLALAGTFGLTGCQADPEETNGHGLPDGGLQRDADPALPDAAPTLDMGAPEPDAQAPEPDAALPPPDAAAPAPDQGLPDDAAPTPDAAPPADAALPDTQVPPPPGDVRLAIEVSNDVPESIFVQLGDALGQPAWVRLEHENTQYFIREMCDVPRCDLPGEGVCGMAMPIVRDMTDGTYEGVQAMVWDGMVSHVTPGADCETREAAPAGAWKATFCWSLQAEFQGEGDASIGRPGEVVNPVCVDVPFELPAATEVVYHINGG